MVVSYSTPAFTDSLPQAPFPTPPAHTQSSMKCNGSSIHHHSHEFCPDIDPASILLASRNDVQPISQPPVACTNVHTVSMPTIYPSHCLPSSTLASSPPRSSMASSSPLPPSPSSSSRNSGQSLTSLTPSLSPSSIISLQRAARHEKKHKISSTNESSSHYHQHQLHQKKQQKKGLQHCHGHQDYQGDQGYSCRRSTTYRDSSNGKDNDNHRSNDDNGDKRSRQPRIVNRSAILTAAEIQTEGRAEGQRGKSSIVTTSMCQQQHHQEETPVKSRLPNWALSIRKSFPWSARNTDERSGIISSPSSSSTSTSAYVSSAGKASTVTHMLSSSSAPSSLASISSSPDITPCLSTPSVGISYNINIDNTNTTAITSPLQDIQGQTQHQDKNQESASRALSSLCSEKLEARTAATTATATVEARAKSTKEAYAAHTRTAAISTATTKRCFSITFPHSCSSFLGQPRIQPLKESRKRKIGSGLITVFCIIAVVILVLC
ncbi:hypothetical protein BX616_001435 [Lobosporangium transversale]|uniref:Uncharacterized protein n=1 Tax=Lobosporangium transversale TaxID=64571 RepID=A0A1Y2GGR5_9FUNG|nr:hypothetical protein BCR41DRAFT_358865 [Lobosporangium transversale]KAF9903997.1 hypothetical protein BX616_001435 [Lobosporangium transversale]ORZ09090.1 hypothetical protein BCR41DRAFT_358865 [Lobosporangium transversale]|eukprot:XP_021878717.1 hypothetical protein BCR41DRAFT_358865 [Lobosporangium transversale]